MKEKGFIFAFVILMSLLCVLGTKKIKSLQTQIKEQKENLTKLNQRLDYVKNLEESLETRRMTGKVLTQIPRVNDPIANKVIIKKFILSFLARMGYQAEVEVENERKSKDFPDMIGVNEVLLKIGFRDNITYNQMTNLMETFRDFPFTVEILTIGGTEVALPGIFRLQLKYYTVPGGT